MCNSNENRRAKGGKSEETDGCGARCSDEVLKILLHLEVHNSRCVLVVMIAGLLR